jgi:hypothetical protein
MNVQAINACAGSLYPGFRQIGERLLWPIPANFIGFCKRVHIFSKISISICPSSGAGIGLARQTKWASFTGVG